MSISNILHSRLNSNPKPSKTYFDIDAEKNILIISNGVVCIEPDMFEDIAPGTVFEEILIPRTVSVIGSRAFEQFRFRKLVIPEGVKSIHSDAFGDLSLTEEIYLPSTLEIVDHFAFSRINREVLKKLVIGNPHMDMISPFTFIGLEDKMAADKSSVRYKAFNCKDDTDSLVCRGFIYKEGRSYYLEGAPECCARGFHFCCTPLECLRYYIGTYDKQGSSDWGIVIHEVTVYGYTDYDIFDITKGCTNDITIGQKLTLQECADKTIEYWQKLKNSND